MLLIELYVIVHNLDTQSLGSWGSLGRIWAGYDHILWAAGTLREHNMGGVGCLRKVRDLNLKSEKNRDLKSNFGG